MSWGKTHHLCAVIISSNNYVYNTLSSSVGAAARRWASRPPRAVDVVVLKDSYDLCLSDQASCYSASSHITCSLISQTHSLTVLLCALDRCLRIYISPVQWPYTNLLYIHIICTLLMCVSVCVILMVLNFLII